MNNNLLTVLSDLVEEHGKAALDDIALVDAALTEKAGEEPKPERFVLLLALTEGCHTELRQAAEEKRPELRVELVQRLYDEQGIDRALSKKTVNLLSALLFGEAPADEPEPEAVEPVVNTAVNTDVDTSTQQANSFKLPENKTEPKKKKSVAAGLFWMYLIASFVIYGVLGSKISGLESANTELESQNAALKSDKNSLLSERTWIETAYKDIWKINVTYLAVGNYNNKWITQPGIWMIASDVRYLTPVWTYNSLISGEFTFFVRIINPDGTINRNSSTSPTGFSYSSKQWIERGQSKELNLSGWGNESVSNYSRGQYTIELWLEDFCLYTGKVTLH